jgi:hypothetical protein
MSRDLHEQQPSQLGRESMRKRLSISSNKPSGVWPGNFSATAGTSHCRHRRAEVMHFAHTPMHRLHCLSDPDVLARND